MVLDDLKYDLNYGDEKVNRYKLIEHLFQRQMGS